MNRFYRLGLQDTRQRPGKGSREEDPEEMRREALPSPCSIIPSEIGRSRLA